MNHFWDRIGISASALCLIHCLATPILALSVPVVGHVFSHEWFHLIVLLIVFPVAAWALWRGYRMHLVKTMLVLGGIGLFFMIVAIFYVGDSQTYLEMLLMVLGGGSLTLAHYMNLRACRRHHKHHN